MIEINLVPSKKGIDLSNIGGFDFTKVNLKLLLLGFILLYIPDFVLVDLWQSEVGEINAKLSELNSEHQKISSKLKDMKALEAQAKAFEEQEKRLTSKLEVVKEIINKRQNPFRLLKYVAENIPTDVWLDGLILEKDVLEVSGKSKTWQSIGGFITNLKGGIFFAKDISYDQPPKNVNEKNRFESFVIKAKIVRYE